MISPDMQKQIEAHVEASRADLIALCADLVAAKSSNPPGETTGPAAVLSRFFAGRGIGSELIAANDSKPNLVADCSATKAGRHLVFNGHIDTLLPGNESEWSVPIYELTEQGDRLYGLGIGNMKAAVAALALAFGFLAANRDLWRGRLTFTAVSDETIFGPSGAGYLLEARPDLAGDALICGEGPGGMNLAIAEKGVCWIEIESRAPTGQGMLSERGSSAIAQLAVAIGELDALNELFVEPPAEVACLSEHADRHGLRLSANVGIIGGGQFVSQAASRAVAEVDFRLPPGLVVEDIEERVAALANGFPAMSWRRLKAWNPNWTPLESPIASQVAWAAEAVRGAPPKPVVRLPASDASRWRARGVPAVCFGPQPTLAAGVDDYALTRDVVDCAKIYALAALAFLTS